MSAPQIPTIRVRLADGIDYEIPRPEHLPAHAAAFYPAFSGGSEDERREAVRELRRLAGWNIEGGLRD